MRVAIAIDPGPSTGTAVISRYSLEREQPPSTGTRMADEVGELLDRYLTHLHGTSSAHVSLENVLVISERFIINQGTLRKTREGTTSIELHGVARFLSRRHDATFIEQPPSDMQVASDEKLRRIGWHSTKDHERAATRHLFAALLNLDLLPQATVRRSIGT